VSSIPTAWKLSGQLDRDRSLERSGQLLVSGVTSKRARLPAADQLLSVHAIAESMNWPRCGSRYRPEHPTLPRLGYAWWAARGLD
jgi:hypothetical protein